MIRGIFSIPILVACLVFVAAGAAAQTATEIKNPHKALKRSCEECHVPTSFTHIRFDHSDTRFHLTGLHTDVKCLACHNVEDFSKVESFCATCHTDIHRNRLGIYCDRCHTADGWTVFDPLGIHQNTNFPIQGKHILIDCLSCHPGMPAADFRRVWTPCYDCHRQEYDSVTNPDHRASGFSQLCQFCHEMTGWTPAIMPDHDVFFPIYSGAHDGRWDTCADCHVASGNYKVFECINCHEHSQSRMDDKHLGEVQGYVYDSAACYECHPRGRAEEDGD